MITRRLFYPAQPLPALVLIYTIFSTVFLAGCASTRLYDGETLSPDKTVQLERGDLAQILIAVDDKESINFFLLNKSIELLPGMHSIAVGYGDGRKAAKTAFPLAFNAQAGKHYVLRSHFIGDQWRPDIVEKSSKTVVSTPLNLAPQYGYPQLEKTAYHKKIDQAFIKAVLAGTPSRTEAARQFATRGWLEKRNGNLDSAMRRFNQAWLLNHNEYQAQWGFGAIMLKKQQPLAATQYFEKALQLLDEDKEKPRLLVDTARAYASQAIHLTQNTPESENALFGKANRLIDQALALDPTYANAYLAGGLIAYESGDYQRASVLVKEARKREVKGFDKDFIQKLSSKMKKP